MHARPGLSMSGACGHYNQRPTEAPVSRNSRGIAASMEAGPRRVHQPPRRPEPPCLGSEAARLAARPDRGQLRPRPAGTDGAHRRTVRCRTPVRCSGPNDCGKSTLLKVIAGELASLTGRAVRDPACVWLDQYLGTLEPTEQHDRPAAGSEPGLWPGPAAHLHGPNRPRRPQGDPACWPATPVSRGLVVVPHDEVFLERLDLIHRLRAITQGWRLA